MSRLWRHRVFGFLYLFFAVLAPARAQSGSRDFFVHEVRNDRAPFLVRVSVDHANQIYHEGETMHVTVRSERGGYLYVLNHGASGKLHCLFPNKFQQNNRIAAHQPIQLPAENANFEFKAGAPFGVEVIKAIVTEKPLKGLDLSELTEAPVTELSERVVKDFYVTELRGSPATWAAHEVRVTTVAKGAAAAPRAKRVGVFVGPSKYRDARIRQLSVCHLDALKMAEVLKKVGGFDEVIVLTNEQATRKAIEDAIRRQLPEATRAGDLVLIYWSGHGGRTADTGGDEPDGHDEYLVPFDASLNDPATMLVDDQFGNWIHDLDGRQVVLILDTCHSGGQPTNEKALGESSHVKGLNTFGAAKSTDEFHFLDGELQRTKDIGQRETSILAASRAAQPAFERVEGDLSVMTYYLVQLLTRADAPVQLQRAYERIRPEVEQYVRERFPGAQQSPILVDQATQPVLLSR